VNSERTETVPGAGARSRAVLVVGAGRSGTSALTRGVQALGVELGDQLRAATGKNPTGFFEDRDLLRIGKEVRARLGLRTASVALVPDHAWRETDLADLRKETVEVVSQRLGRAPIWGFKYSQTLRFLPFWEDALREAQVDPCYVLALRNPLSVARSRAKLDKRRGVQEKSDLEWLVAVVPYLRRMAAHPSVLVDFDLLMAEPERQLRRVAAGLRLPVDEAVDASLEAYVASFLKEEMRHTVFDDSALDQAERLNTLTRDAYRWLRRLATDELGLESQEFWQEWSRIEARVADLAPVLEHLDRVEEELRPLGWSLRTWLRQIATRMPRPARR